MEFNNEELNIETNELDNITDNSVDNNEVESGKSISSETVGRIIAFGLGVAAPFVVKGLIKAGKWVVNKFKSRKANKSSCDGDSPDSDDKE